MDLTKAEIYEAITELFHPVRITCLKKLKDCFRLKIHTKWETTEDDGETVEEIIVDEIELRDPWIYGEDSISWDYRSGNDYMKFRKYCFAKGICSYAVNNPFLEVANDE
jgi:hypothetical protein